MRGSPLIRALLAFAALLLLGFPIWKITHPNAASAALENPNPAKNEKQNVKLQLTFAHPAAKVEVLYLGQSIWSEKNPAANIERVFSIEFPKEGIDLEIKAQWPPSTPATAIRAKLTTPA